MLKKTLNFLQCPHCNQKLFLKNEKFYKKTTEITSGTLFCKKCKSCFPILAGIAIIVSDIASYLIEHVKGISRVVPDSLIPKQFLADYLEAKSQLQQEHIDEDLESERVVSLYFMNQYFESKQDWYHSTSGKTNELIQSLIKEYWDQSPLSIISKWIREIKDQPQNILELGCGVGSLANKLKNNSDFYLGVDSSFASVALARYLNLGSNHPDKIKIPNELLNGSISHPIKPLCKKYFDEKCDFIVCDIEKLPIINNTFNLSIALNAIDMLYDPTTLPKIQNKVTIKNGYSIQSSPYIWHEQIAKSLKKNIPKNITDSAQAVQWLYEKSDFKILKSIENHPWLFFKNVRQLEIYSVHLFLSQLK